MPEMTGVEFLRRAAKLRPDATRLLFTGYADIKAVIDAINQGHVFRYLAKPWDPEELEAVVNVVGLTSAGLETETFRVSGMATSDAAIAAIS